MDDKLKYIEEFKQKFLKEVPEIDYNDFTKHFFVDNYFIYTKEKYTPERFYYILAQICVNIIRSNLQEVDYYINLRPTTPIAQADITSIKDTKIFQEFSLELNIQTKKYALLFLKHNLEPKKIKDFAIENLKTMKKLHEYHTTILENSIKLIEEKKIELTKKEDKKFESQIFN